MVYNHTAEGEADGPTYSFRGLDDLGFYKRSGAHRAAPTGTSPAAATPSTPRTSGALRLILDSLRYWVTEMHVDGFRFDLASALARTGHDIDMRSAFLTTIGQDPVLRYVKLIAEPWDASMDGYLVGSFPPPWVEWNDTLPRHHARLLAPRPARPRGRLPAVRLLGPVRRRRAVAVRLGELRDRPRRLHACATWCPTTTSTTRPTARATGTAPTTTGPGTTASRARPTTPRSLALRRRQAANLMATLCLSSGCPMITAGDERGRTQRGNNNAYVPGQRGLAGSTGGPTTPGSTSTRSPRPRCVCAATTRRCASATTSRARRRSTAAPRTSPGSTRTAGR